MGNCRSWRSTEQSYRGNSTNCKTRAAKRGLRPPGSVEYLNFGFSLINKTLCASRRTETKTDPLTSSFWNGKRCNLSTIVGLNPFQWECSRVLRPLWTELPAQTVRVYSLQKSAHAVLVSIHEFGDDFCGRAVQHHSWPVPVAPAGDVKARANLVSQLVLVRSEIRPVRLGASSRRPARLGLFCLERGPAEGQGLVHAQTFDVLAGRWRSSAASLVDSRRPATRAILRYDRPAPGRAHPAGLGRGNGCHHCSLH